MASVTINGGGGTYLETPMYTGLTMGANEYPKGTVTFSLAAGWFFLNAGRSSESYTFTLYVCDSDGYNTITLGSFTINGMNSKTGVSFTVNNVDKPGLKGKKIYIKTTGSKEWSYIRLNSTATLTMATVTTGYSITTSAGTGGSLSASKSTAAAGETITLTPSAQSGYTFSSYTKNPANLTITNNTFTMPASNVSITANFTKASYTITKVASPSTGGTVTTSKNTANKGDEITITVTAASGYRHKSTTTSPSLTITNNKFTMPAGNVTVTATFEKISYSVTTSAGTGGSLTANKSTATIGDTITLTPTASSGYTFSGYTSSPSVSISGNSFTMPASNVTVTASFTKKNYTISIASATGGSATASKYQATAGETITLTASPSTGYKLNSWTTSPAVTVSGNKFTMPASNITVTPSFTKVNYTITTTAGTGGTLTANKSTANYGTIVTLTPTASSGYTFSGYSSSPSVSISNNTFTMPASNITITATFTKISYTITKAVSPSGTGTITTSKTTAGKGDTITLTASPASGYHLSSWTTSPALTVSNNKFTMPASNVTVTGNFAKTNYTITKVVNPSGAGTVTISKSTANKGDSITVSASANTGYQFSSWSSSPSVTISSGAFTMPASNVTLTANFKRRSTGTLSSSSMSGGGTVTLTINSESTAYTHKYKLSFGTGMETSLTNVAAGTKTVSISIPASWSDAIPNATSKGSGTLTLYTYSGGSQVASAYTITGLTYNVPSTVVPTIGTITLTRVTSYGGHTYSDLGGYYVQNHCEVRVQATASGARSSTISSYTLAISGYSTTDYKKTLAPGTASSSMDFTSGPMYLAGSTTVTLTATDSRGRKTTKTTTFTVSAYTSPTGTLSVRRVDSNRDDDPMGTYGAYTLTKSYTQLGNNSLTSTLKYSSFTASSPAASGDLMPGSRKTFNVDNEYTVQLILQDALETVTITTKLPTARYIIYVDETGNRIGFLKKPNKTIPSGKARTFEISADTQVYIGDDMLEELIWNKCFRNLYCPVGTTNLHVQSGTRARIDFITYSSTRNGSVLVYCEPSSGNVVLSNQETGSNLALATSANTIAVTMSSAGGRAFCTIYEGDMSVAT